MTVNTGTIDLNANSTFNGLLTVANGATIQNDNVNNLLHQFLNTPGNCVTVAEGGDQGDPERLANARRRLARCLFDARREIEAARVFAEIVQKEGAGEAQLTDRILFWAADRLRGTGTELQAGDRARALLSNDVGEIPARRPELLRLAHRPMVQRCIATQVASRLARACPSRQCDRRSQSNRA